MFIPGKEYKRSEIHDEYGGNRQAGICPANKTNIILLFSYKSGANFGYVDKWRDGIYHYTGEGKIGDMEFTRGNKSLLNHLSDNTDLHLFKETEKRYVKYIGQMLYSGHYTTECEDKDGENRRCIIFKLLPMADISILDGSDEVKRIDEDYDNKTLLELRELAREKAVEKVDEIEIKTVFRQRSLAIKKYALKRAQGDCEYCGTKAPFMTKKGSPYLEVHHILKLSDDGPDDPNYVASLCPNCHRAAHHSTESGLINEKIIKIITDKERSF